MAATIDSEYLWIGRPAAKAFDTSYVPPPPPANPVVRGLPLYYGAHLVSRSGLLQNLLWNNAGFDKLRRLPEIEDVEPRYDPTVIKTPRRPQDAKKDYVKTMLSEYSEPLSTTAKTYSSVLDYHHAYSSGRTTPTAVANALLPLIRRDVAHRSKHSTAFLASNVELILAAAEASTERYRSQQPLSPLDGVPVAVKDELDITGYRRCLGSKLDLTRKDDATSYCVQRWLDAGAIIVGKTSMHEFGMDTTNNNPNFGTPLNPHNKRYYCGGSSGGSAYAVAAGLVPVAMGTDGGGSIRIPAAYCGLYGLKPSHGRVSISPSANLAKSTDVVGPITANMIDLEIAYRIMAQPDHSDSAANVFAVPAFVREPKRTQPKFLGFFAHWFDRADPPVRAACQAALDYLVSEHGYEIVPITIPLVHEGQLAHAITIMTEITATLSPSALEKLTSANKVLLSVGAKTPSVDFLAAQKVRTVLMQHLASLYTAYPGLIVVTPTTPNVGWAHEDADLIYGCSDANMQVRNMEYVWLANFVGCPALTAPVAYAESTAGTGRVPIGLMGMAEWGEEDLLVALGYDLEAYMTEEVKGGRARPGTFVQAL